MKFDDKFNKSTLDMLVNQLKSLQIGHLQEKSEYIKDLEQAYMDTKANDSERFK